MILIDSVVGTAPVMADPTVLPSVTEEAAIREDDSLPIRTLTPADDCTTTADEPNLPTSQQETVPSQLPVYSYNIPTETSTINWELCALCQTSKKEKLINPSESKFAKSGVQLGYRHTVENILKLKELGKLNLPIKKELLDEGVDMVSVFETKKALWHRTCRNKVDNQKVE